MAVLMNVVIVVVIVALLLRVFPSLYFSILVALVKVIGIHLHLSHIFLHWEKILFR